ncbi:mrna surveillance protein pelota [Nannochloropsis oceanica]
MKLVSRDVSGKDGEGTVVLRPEEPEDMWAIYNLISEGDLVRTTTFRKVVKESATGSTTSSKIRLNLTIQVERVQFDPDTCVLRLSGRNREESEHVKMGAYHTLDLELQRNFTIQKTCWDTVVLDRLDEACDPVKQAEVAAIVMQPGLANICLLTGSMTIVRQRIDMSIPKKRAGNVAHDKALQKFYRATYEALIRHINFGLVKAVLLASPGFVNSDFFAFMNAEAQLKEDKPLLQNKAKFVLCHSSSGHKHALEEVLTQPGIQARLSDTKAVGEVQALGDFYAMLSAQPDRAHYGFNHVSVAAEHDAVEMLLMSDSIFRGRDFLARRRFVDLVESVKAKGGRFLCFSSLHVTGEKLHQLGGVAAVLRFPLEIEMEEEDLPLEEGGKGSSSNGVCGGGGRGSNKDGDVGDFYSGEPIEQHEDEDREERHRAVEEEGMEAIREATDLEGMGL